MNLETQRLRFRKLNETDLENLFRLHSNPEVMKFIRPPDEHMAQTQLRLEQNLDIYEKHPGYGVFPLNLKSDDTFIGWGVIVHVDELKEVEIGYRFFPEHWGKGYATETAAALRDYGFETLKLKRIIGLTHRGNLASQRVLEKTGLLFEKELVYHNTDAFLFGMERK